MQDKLLLSHLLLIIGLRGIINLPSRKESERNGRDLQMSSFLWQQAPGVPGLVSTKNEQNT